MAKSLLVSNVLPKEALDLIPKGTTVDYNSGDTALPKAEFLARLRDKDGLICHIISTIDDEVLAAAPTLKVVANVAVGYNNIDVAAARRRGVVVTNTPDVLTETTADFAWALLMAAARRVVEADQFARSGQWQRWQWDLLWGADVHGKTLGILGFGRIGRAVGRRAAGFSMRVLYHDAVRPEPAVERELRATYAEPDAILREADFVSLHTPLLPETRHLVNERTLRLMTHAPAHEEDGDPRQRRTRADRGRSRARAGAQGGLDRGRRNRRLRGGAQDPPRAPAAPERRAGAAHRERLARHAHRHGEPRGAELPRGAGRQAPADARALSAAGGYTPRRPAAARRRSSRPSRCASAPTTRAGAPAEPARPTS